MAKRKEIYRCAVCGYETSKWAGQCPECRAWNQMKLVEEVAVGGLGASSEKEPRIRKPEHISRLTDVTYDIGQRMSTGIGELDRVLGLSLIHI